jgi:antitoxin MazE
MSDAKVSKWGNSLTIRIPRRFAKEARLTQGDRVTVDLAADRSIVLRSTRPKYDLHQLVAKITKKNRHAAVDWGSPVGKEVIIAVSRAD